MSNPPNDLPPILAVLEPYLPDLILIGGWVPELYRRFGGVEWSGRVSRTTELDVLVHSPLARNGRESLPALLKAHGLRPARKDVFPADWVSSDSDVTAIEFITNRNGPFGSASPSLIEEQGWLGAIVVERAELLAAFTRTLTIRIADQSLPVRVPTLGAWAVSKALSYGARQASASGILSSEKRAKDLLYLRDLVFAGGTVLKQVAADVSLIAAEARWHTLLKDALERLAPVAESGASEEVAKAGLELATRDGVSETAAVAEIRSAARELRELIDEGLRRC
jgi:hypothetical protein